MNMILQLYPDLWLGARVMMTIYDYYFLLQVACPRNGLKRNLLRPMLPGKSKYYDCVHSFHVRVGRLCIILVALEK
jgi:hypothetical protein